MSPATGTYSSFTAAGSDMENLAKVLFLGRLFMVERRCTVKEEFNEDYVTGCYWA